MSGSIYATRVTVVQNGDGAGVELDSGNPVWVHSVHLANGSAGTVTPLFTQTTTAGGAIATEVGAMSATAGGADDWTPEAIFDKGFRVAAEPAASVYITVTWRLCG